MTALRLLACAFAITAAEGHESRCPFAHLCRASGKDREACHAAAHGHEARKTALLQHRAMQSSEPGWKIPSAASTASFDHPEWLSQCEQIYLDVGSNMGVQVRKLFEPAKYPGAQALKLFDKAFGPVESRSELGDKICALGFEPNPKRLPRLKQLQEAYVKRGFRVHFYPYAVWKSEGKLAFNVTDNPEHADWTARLDMLQEDPDKMPKMPAVEGWRMVDIRTVDLSAFVRTELPQGSVKLMKMDVEGAEYETLAKMLHDETLCKDLVPKIFIEAHKWGDISTWKGPRTLRAIRHRVFGQDVCNARGGTTDVADVDDESYLFDVDNDFAGSA